MSDNLSQFQQRLDACHEFPCAYVFKFIVPKASTGDLEAVLGEAAYTCRESSSGKFISYTAEIQMESSTDVVSMYQAAAKVEGLIAL